MSTHRAPLFVALAVVAAAVLISAHSAPTHLDRALAAQRALVDQNPGDANALNDLGNLLELSGDRRGAEKAYTKSIELAPDEPSTHFNYGLLLLSTGQRRPALKQFREVVELDPGHAWAHYEIGAIWDGWGFERWARRSYARAFELDPQLADIRVNPDVIDNRQATAAMLMAWSRGTPAASAPRDYSDGGRIASLLIEVPVQKAERTEEEPLDGGGEGSEGGFARITSPPLSAPAGSRAGDGGPDEFAGKGSDREPRVLEASDLPPSRTINQISVPPGAARSPAPRSTRPQIIRRTPPFTTNRGSTGRLEPAFRPVDPGAEVIAG